MSRRVNHWPLGQCHMLDKIAYDYVTKIKTRGANKSKIKYELAEKAKKFTDEDKNQLRRLIQKWQELKK